MKISKTVFGLSIVIIILGLSATCVGLFWQSSGDTSNFLTLHGQTVEIYGQGIYRFDSLFSGAGYKGTDMVVLGLGLPFLLILTLLYRKGSLRAGLLLIGIFSFIFYVYSSMALGAAYNNLFLVYVALFSASFFALILMFRSITLAGLSAQEMASLPRRFTAFLLFACGFITIFVWLIPIVSSLMSGQTPDRLDNYTTLVTYALDLAIITPSTFLAGVLILKRIPLGYVMAFALFGIIIMLAPGIISSTSSQIRAGVSYTTGEFIGPTAGFVILGLLAVWVVVAILRKMPNKISNKGNS